MNQILACVVIVATLLKTEGCLTISSSKQNWINAISACSLAGSSVFFDSDFGTHKADNINISNISFKNNSLPAWIYAYKQVSNVWIAYEGCFDVSNKDIYNNKTMLNFSVPTECYKYCRSKFAMQNHSCHCVDGATFKKITYKDKPGFCNIKCTEKPYYRCGGTNNTFSLYNYYGFPMSSSDEQCLVKTLNAIIVSNCNDKYQCICLNETGKTSTFYGLSWTDCFKNCIQNNTKPAVLLPKAPNITQIDANISYWSGYFKIFPYEWDKEPSKQNLICLALDRNEANQLKFVTRDCNEKINALCVTENMEITAVEGSTREPNITNEVTLGSKPDTETTTPFVTKTRFETTTQLNTIDENTIETTFGPTLKNAANENQQTQNNLYLIVAVVLSLVGNIIAILIIVIIVCKRKRQSVEMDNSRLKNKTQTDSTLNAEPIFKANNDSGGTLSFKPFSGFEMEMNNSNEDENAAYDHLHSTRTVKTTVTKSEGLYDHTGIFLNGYYDRVVLTQKAIDNDDTYDHTGRNISGRNPTGSDMKPKDDTYDHTGHYFRDNDPTRSHMNPTDDTYDHTGQILIKGNDALDDRVKVQARIVMTNGNDTPKDDTNGQTEPDVNIDKEQTGPDVNKDNETFKDQIYSVIKSGNDTPESCNEDV